MRRTFLSLAALITLLLISSMPTSFMQVVRASAGTVAQVAVSNPVSNGAITPGEYSESYFDETTKNLVYLTCDNSTERLLHVGIVSPWAGWTGFMVQASDDWNGVLNEVRVSYAPSFGGLQVLDAYANVTVDFTAPDSVLGGSSNVIDASTGTIEGARVYEFSVPLRSTDAYDSQLQGAGPFYFALEYSVSDTDLRSDATGVSELKSLALENDGTPKKWTSLELALSPSSKPLETPTILLSLRDEGGNPLPGSQLEVFLRSSFGLLELGPVVTNDQGVAEVAYFPRDNGTFLVGAAYAGGGGLLASVAWRFLNVVRTSQDGGPELRPIEAIISVTLTGVWAAYAYAFFVTRQTMHSRRTDSLYSETLKTQVTRGRVKK